MSVTRILCPCVRVSVCTSQSISVPAICTAGPWCVLIFSSTWWTMQLRENCSLKGEKTFIWCNNKIWKALLLKQYFEEIHRHFARKILRNCCWNRYEYKQIKYGRIQQNWAHFEDLALSTLSPQYHVWRASQNGNRKYEIGLLSHTRKITGGSFYFKSL